MYEGTKIKYVYPCNSVIYDAIIAHADPEKGITIIDADNPDKIVACYLPTYRVFPTALKSLEKAVETGIWDAGEEMKEAYNYTNEELFLLSEVLYLGSTQEELKKLCPFK